MDLARIPFVRPALLLAVAGALGCAEAPPPPPVAAAPPTPPAPTLRAPDFSAPAREAEPHTLEIRLAPARDGAEIAHVAVTLRFSEPPGEFAEPGPLVLAMPAREDGEAIADAVDEVSARDAEGALTLRPAQVDGPGEPRATWRSDRRPVGVVTVSYRVRLGPAVERRHTGARAHAGGFQATGRTLLLLPETADTYRVRLAWDLAAAGEGARAESSLGEGDAEARLTMNRLRAAVMMAGPLGRVAIDAGGARFEGAWLGRPAFDPVEAIPWAARAFAAQRAFFRDADAAPFTLLARVVPGAEIGGEARLDGVLVYAGEQAGWDRAARFAVARAIVRRWIGGADHGLRFDGPGSITTALTDGLAAHYARELLLRAGLCTPEEAAEDLRDRLERHAITPGPEGRGLLYAADLDAAVRARSGGKRSLDDLVLALLDRARQPGREGGGTAPVPASALRDLVGAEIGPEGQARFDAALARGETITPPADAFGPCFKPVKQNVRVDPRARPVPVNMWARDPKVAASTCARRR